jgi:hypothetical protein
MTAGLLVDFAPLKRISDWLRVDVALACLL